MDSQEFPNIRTRPSISIPTYTYQEWIELSPEDAPDVILSLAINASTRLAKTSWNRWKHNILRGVIQQHPQPLSDAQLNKQLSASIKSKVRLAAPPKLDHTALLNQLMQNDEGDKRPELNFQMLLLNAGLPIHTEPQPFQGAGKAPRPFQGAGKTPRPFQGAGKTPRPFQGVDKETMPMEDRPLKRPKPIFAEDTAPTTGKTLPALKRQRLERLQAEIEEERIQSEMEEERRVTKRKTPEVRRRIHTGQPLRKHARTEPILPLPQDDTIAQIPTTTPVGTIHDVPIPRPNLLPPDRPRFSLTMLPKPRTHVSIPQLTPPHQPAQILLPLQLLPYQTPPTHPSPLPSQNPTISSVATPNSEEQGAWVNQMEDHLDSPTSREELSLIDVGTPITFPQDNASQIEESFIEEESFAGDETFPAYHPPRFIPQIIPERQPTPPPARRPHKPEDPSDESDSSETSAAIGKYYFDSFSANPHTNEIEFTFHLIEDMSSSTVKRRPREQNNPNTFFYFCKLI